MNTKIAHRYAEALYLASERAGNISQIIEDVNNVIRLIKRERSLLLFFYNPIISPSKKEKIVEEIFSSIVHKLLVSFLKLIVRANRGSFILEILENFILYKEEKEGKIRVNVTTAVEVNDELKDKFVNLIRKLSGLEPLTTFRKEKGLIGGFTVRIQDTIYDASLKRQLEMIDSRFKRQHLKL
ncbi:MAG: ATP synthase F1 subunit delta [Ignavibacteria bacterium]